MEQWLLIYNVDERNEVVSLKFMSWVEYKILQIMKISKSDNLWQECNTMSFQFYEEPINKIATF